MRSAFGVLALAAFAAAAPSKLHQAEKKATPELLTDIDKIQTYWGGQRPYKPTPSDYFGVENAGLPDGCGYEQIHILHRHGARYPTAFGEDGTNDELFISKLLNISSMEGKNTFYGPLDFLNDYTYQLGLSLLLPTGSSQEYQSATDFWNTRGRLLFNASAGEAYYNATLANGTTLPKMTFRTTSQSRILASAYAWVAGFFGPTNTSAQYDFTIITEGGGAADPLALDCENSDIPAIGYTGDDYVFDFIPLYLTEATERFNNYLADGPYSFNVNDTYAMQSICTYEYVTFGDSDFCYLFTENEWKGFAYSLNLEYYYDFSFGQATGKAQGIGYVEELMARLTHHLINTTDSNINTTLDGSEATFPLNQKLYMDMSHDDVQVSVITALGVNYFRGALPVEAGAELTPRSFEISYMTPFSSRLNTEVIGCNSPTPTEIKKNRVLYTPNQNGYDPATATNKFVRMTWNGGVVPLDSIDGGFCGGRTDGLCPLEAFLASQANASAVANYEYACNGNYTTLAKFVPDSGTIFP
ncbi:hypothetical protein MNV49_007541 [Pseudohyphozyma bogoriensis]|nr:hypothetical protein MNV49_007541 [Pseudohyphozyma bogoriensis]